jgi:hypothetical protein
MPSPPRPKRITASFRMAVTTLEQLRSFVRDHAGKPLYLEQSLFVERAILREIARTERILAAGGTSIDEDPPSQSSRPVETVNSQD